MGKLSTNTAISPNIPLETNQTIYVVTGSVLMILMLLISQNQDVSAGSGLRVFVHDGEGQVCVTSDNENAGCEFADDDGSKLEFEFSPGAVDVGENFSVCDNNWCVEHENRPEKVPENVHMLGSQNSVNTNTYDDVFKILLTFVEGPLRGHIDQVKTYIYEYPQYYSEIDLNDAFYNDSPFTGEYTSEMEMPSGIIKVGENFRICLDDGNTETTLACYMLENTEKIAPETLTIDFNNFS